MELINVLKCLCALMLPCFPKPHNVLWWEEITCRCISHTHTVIFIVYGVQLECSAGVFCLCSSGHLLCVCVCVCRCLEPCETTATNSEEIQTHMAVIFQLGEML